MNNKNLKDVAIFFVIVSLVIFFSSTVFAGGSFTFKWGKDKEPENTQVKHTYKGGTASPCSGSWISRKA